MSRLPRCRAIACFFICIVSVFSALAHADADLDRQYALESVGFIRPLGRYGKASEKAVESAYWNYFSSQSRFKGVDISEYDASLLHSMTPYADLVRDPFALRELARIAGVQSLIRTEVSQNAGRYRIRLEWLVVPEMLPVLTRTRSLKIPLSGDFAQLSVQAQIEEALDKLIKKLPWIAHVTKRKESRIRINAGADRGLKEGDVLRISTLEEVARHPEPSAAVEWYFKGVGAAEIDSVSDESASAHILSEAKAYPVDVFQKVTRVLRDGRVVLLRIGDRGEETPASTSDDGDGGGGGGVEDGDGELSGNPMDIPEIDAQWGREGQSAHLSGPSAAYPEGDFGYGDLGYGNGADYEGSMANPGAPKDSGQSASTSSKKRPPSSIHFGVWIGKNDESSSNGTGGQSGTAGGGWLLGVRGGGRLWLFRPLMADLDLGYGLMPSYTLSQQTAGGPSASGSASLLPFRVSLGYAYWLSDDVVSGSNLFAKIGYQSLKYTFPPAVNSNAPLTGTSVFAGLGTTIAFSQRWNLESEVDLGVINSASGISGITGASALALSFDAGYKLGPRWSVHGKFEIFMNQINGPSGAYISEKVFSLSPLLSYSF